MPRRSFFLGLLLLLAITVPTYATVIDSFFGSGPANLTGTVYDGFTPVGTPIPNNAVVVNSFPSATVVDTVSGVPAGIGFGGSRFGSLDITSANAGDRIEASIVAGSFILQSTDVGTGTMGSVGLLYDFPAAVDLSSESSIDLDFANFNIGDGGEDVTMTITSGASTYTDTIALGAFTGGIVSFDLATVPASILGSVDEIAFDFTIDSGTDFELVNIYTTVVPEPVSALCWVGALIGLIGVRRFRRR